MMKNEMPEPFAATFAGQALTLPLLSTKLFVPPPRAALVSRPRLVARLNQGLAHPLTLISAPAGYGKTTLVSEWRASVGRDVSIAWLSLDPEDNAATRFLSYLAAALGTVMPDLAEIYPDTLQVPQLPQAWLTSLINDLGALPHPFVLVLDDYHVITDEGVHTALDFLLTHLPPKLHLILLTREDPPLPLASMRARNQLVEIHASDLRFTPSEAADFFQQTMGLRLSPDEVAALEQRTEGWIAGLQLAALAIQNPRASAAAGDVSAFMPGFTGSHHYVIDYLSAEVLSHLPEPVSSFLLQTSILERMTGELCDRLLETSDSQAMLRRLDHANLFLVPLDEERRWYRYHHLFAELLRNQLRETFPERIFELHRRAAIWFEQHGYVSEAILHALAAGDQQLTARMVEQNALATLMRGDSTTVLNWISPIASLIPERPWLAIYQSWALVITGQIEPIDSLLQGAESRLASVLPTDAQKMGFHIAAIRALVADRRGEAHQAIDLARQALARLPEDESVLRSVVLLTLADSSWAAGDLAGAMQVFIELGRIDTSVGNFVPVTGALASVAGLQIEQGQLHQASETYRQVLQKSTRGDGRIMPAAAPAYLGLSNLAYEWNDLDSAERYARQALELAHRWGNPDTIAGIYLLQARLKQAQGDSQDSSQALRQAEELRRGGGVSPATSSRIDDFRVLRWLEQANFEAAARWRREQALDPGDELSYPRQISYLTLARILAAQGETEAALALQERLQAQFEASGQLGRLLELLLLQALTLEAQGEPSAALAVLARALTLGEPEGYLRLFLDEGAPMAGLLRHAGSLGMAPQYAAKLLSEYHRGAGSAPAFQQPLIEPLTDRELQVLHLIAEGLSNQLIAERLVIAVGTVKTHTASLYRKLGVTSRTQAVRRATDLSLLQRLPPNQT